MAAGITYPLFSGDGYNVDALLGGVRQAGQRRGKAIIILNFPNNPTGYSLTLEEADRITAGLLEIAREGTDILAITDDAYFGLQYEDNLLRESMFARLAGLHPNILAVKADGPTKEDYVWGFGWASSPSAVRPHGSAVRCADKEARRHHPFERLEFVQPFPEPFAQGPGL